MPIKNYTTKIDAAKTVGEIQAILAKKGARQIMFNYSSEGHIEYLCFTIETPHGMQGVKLPSNTDRLLAVLKRDGIKADYTKAENIAWRIVKDWLDAQLAILETEMVTIDQVLLPYYVNGEGQTVFELYDNGTLRLEG